MALATQDGRHAGGDRDSGLFVYSGLLGQWDPLAACPLHNSVQRTLVGGIGLPLHEGSPKTKARPGKARHHLLHPGSRPGSLQDRWAGGTATCQPHQMVFQEVMSGTDVSLGAPTTLDVVSVRGPARPVTGRMTSYLPPGMKVMTFALAHGTVDMAAAPADLAIVEQQLLHGGRAT